MVRVRRQSKGLRIRLRPRPVEKPDTTQLVFWALREGILQRMSPTEAHLPAERISFATIMRLSVLYKASVERWKQREAAELAASRSNTAPLRELVVRALKQLGVY